MLRPHTQRSAADRLAPWSTRARNQGLIGQRIDSRHGNDQERCSSGQADSPHWERALPGPEDGVGRDSERSSDEEQPGQGLRVEDVVDLATGTRNLGEVSQPAGFEALGKADEHEGQQHCQWNRDQRSQPRAQSDGQRRVAACAAAAATMIGCGSRLPVWAWVNHMTGARNATTPATAGGRTNAAKTCSHERRTVAEPSKRRARRNRLADIAAPRQMIGRTMAPVKNAVACSAKGTPVPLGVNVPT